MNYSGYSILGAGLSIGYVLFCLALGALLLASYWILFQKAGQPGWAAIIPIYNLYIMLKIGGKPGWWLLLMLIPLVNIVIECIAIYSFLKAYGRGSAGAFLLYLFFSPIYVPYLAFSRNVQYVGV